MSNPAGVRASDQPLGNNAGSGSPTDDDMNVESLAAPGVAGGNPTDDDMSVAREPEDPDESESGEAGGEAPQPLPGMAANPPGQGLDVDRGALPAGGAAETTTSGREGAGAFNAYPGPQGALGAMPGSDMAQEPGGTGYVGNDELIHLPDE